MRGLGYALILFGIITAVLILLYGSYIGWSGLVGSCVAVMAGVGFLYLAGDCCGKDHCQSSCCNRY